MSGRQKHGYSDKHTLPENPTWVEFSNSDGDESLWPTNTTRQVDSDGNVNFMRPVSLDELGVSIKWRVEVATALAVLLKWPEGPSYVLKGWPKGYGMYDHHKGPRDAPRHDVYLFGSKSRYRSVPEFIPHAFWLMDDPTLDRANCKCKYCSKKAQRVITSSMTFLPQARYSPYSNSAGGYRNRDLSSKARGKAREQQVPHRLYAAVQRVPKPLRSMQMPQIPVLRERNNDLRAASSKSSMRLKRWFREGELLWCYLDPPIHSGKDDISIRFWPGLVQEVRLKSDAIPRTVDDNKNMTKTNGTERPGTEGDGNDDDSMRWTIRQSTSYKMKLLAVSHSYTIPDEKVLPNQAYIPPKNLLETVRELALANLDIDAESMAKFNPCPPMSGTGQRENGAVFADSVAPYSVAIQTGAKLASYWSLTDYWEFKYTVSPGDDPTSNILATSTQASNGAGNASGTGLNVHRNISGVRKSMSEQELQTLGTRMLGLPAPPAQTVTQMRCQGLWWGAERIWTDELIRLKLARKQLAPQGAADIYPPAGPSQKTLDYNSNLLPTGDVTEADLGAGARGLFLRLDGLFAVETPREDGLGTRKECRASGMLYELADEDWPDPYADVHKEFALEKEKKKLGELWSGSGGGANGESSSSSTHLTPHDTLSHPISSSPYPLPQPPAGFKFRPILPPGREVVISLTLISGRYYPNILVHPLLLPSVHEAYANPLENGGLNRANHLWALEGLSGGYFNSVDPTKAKTSRIVMMRDADNEARMEIEEACAARDVEMHTDGDGDVLMAMA